MSLAIEIEELIDDAPVADQEASADWRELYRPSFWRWSLAAAGDWSVIAGTLALAGSWNHWLGYILAVLVVGNRQHALGILGHDGTHRLISRNKRLNDWTVSLVCFWPLMTGLDAYRRFHFAHHRHLGTRRDPELYQKGINEPEYDLPATRGQLLRSFITDLLGFAVPGIVKVQLTDFWPASWADRLGPVAWWLAVGPVLVMTGNWWVIAIWFVALWTSMWAFFRVRIWTEHQGVADTHRISVNWLQRLLVPHNTWYHYEHHKWPAVPYWKLPQARELDATPVVTLSSLLKSFAGASHVPSGQTLADHETDEERRARISRFAIGRPGVE